MRRTAEDNRRRRQEILLKRFREEVEKQRRERAREIEEAERLFQAIKSPSMRRAALASF